MQRSARPASYSASSNNEVLATVIPLNNLDTLRSYGSAGDELENVPPDYRRNLNRSPQHKINNGQFKTTIYECTYTVKLTKWFYYCLDHLILNQPMSSTNKCIFKLNYFFELIQILSQIWNASQNWLAGPWAVWRMKQGLLEVIVTLVTLK